MAYDGRSDEFDLDDDGILRDSMAGEDDLLIDDDGIVRGGGDLDLYKHVTRGHWTDSGIGGDKQSVTSTLKNLQNSFEEDLAPIGDESINISEFEASKDDLSDDDFAGGSSSKRRHGKVSGSLMDTLGSTLDKPGDDHYEDGPPSKLDKRAQKTNSQNAAEFDRLAEDFDNRQLFTREYYDQLRELGVLVDGADSSRDSLNEFEELESRVTSRQGEYDDTIKEDNRDLIGEYLESEYYRERMEDEGDEEENDDDERERRGGKKGREVRNDKEMRRVNNNNTNNGKAKLYDEGVGEMMGYESRPSSGRTISSRTFPDDEDYGDDDFDKKFNESQNLGSQGGSQSQKTTGDDDEIFFINTHGRVPSSGKVGTTNAASTNLQRRRDSQGSRNGAESGRSRTPVRGGGGVVAGVGTGARQSPSLYGRKRGDDHHDNYDDEDTTSFYSESATHRSRPSSVTSHVSTASENVTARQKRAESLALQRMSKAKSQESFFEDGEQPHQKQPSSKEKGQSPGHHHHKRLLPTPNTSVSGSISGGGDPNQSFKMKSSKSVTNISSGPVKPTHMSISEITRLTNLNLDHSGGGDGHGGATEDDSVDLGDKSTGELTDRLTQESQKRKHATELVQQLQLDYDSLLTKYALAELTIDQMRLGAKINIHTDSPTPGQAHTGVMSPVVGHSPQVLQLRSSPSQASLRSSPAQGVLGYTSPLVDSGNQTADARAGGTTPDPRSQGARSVSVGDSEDGLREDAMTETEKVKVDLQVQARGLDERLDTFYSMMENQQLTLNQEATVFEEIRSEHDSLRRSYLQAKDDYNVLRRSGAFTNDAQQQFDSTKELEGQLFRLGMRFDEVHERVEGNQQKKSEARQPFQPKDVNRSFDRDSNNSKPDQTDGRINGQGGRGVDGAATPTMQHSQSMDFTDGPITERRVNELRDEYNTSMDAYRKLKYTDETPDGQQEVDNVVRRLHGICSEMPEMFRLSPEIQQRWDNLATKDKINLADRKTSVWEKLNKREQTMKNQRQSPVSQSPRHRTGSGRGSPVDGRPPSILRQTSEGSDLDSLRLRLDGSRSSFGSILPDRMDRPPSRSNPDRPSSRSGNHTDRDRPLSRLSNTGYDYDDQNRPPSRSGGGSDRHSSNPNLPRPRRHDQRGVRDPKLGPMPNMGSMHSLPDSGISDQENGTRRRNSRQEGGRQSPAGARGGATGATSGDLLDALPSSRFKQMTKQRAADDADSGFLGSMVGSGVGLPPGAQTQQQQQQQQQQQNQQQQVLRLRRPADESISTTDQSMDTSGVEERPKSHRTKTDRGERSRQRSQGTSSMAVGQSYDGSEDTLEDTTQDIDTSMERHMARNRDKARGGGAIPKTKKRNDSRDLSTEATLEDDITEESDVSTPRALPLTPKSKSKEKSRRSSEKSPPTKEKTSNQQKAATKSSKHQSSSTKQQTTSEEDDDLKKALEMERARQSKSQSLKDSSLDESMRQKRLKSPPPVMPTMTRPKSRGSPTTDLFKTRERRASGDSVRSRRSVREEVTREERRQQDQPRAELRMDRRGPDVDRPRARPPDYDDTDGLPRNLRNNDIADHVRDYETRSIASSDVEIGSNLTRASSTNSNRLKALQEEIEKLKEGVAKANEKNSQPPPPHPVFPGHPPPAAAAQTQQQSPEQQQQRRDEPDFYDPFDDPYGFMRMPRRRANSFSGGREREWDEWYWTLPQNKQYDGADIPLGYAAADAYADVVPPNPGTAKGSERNSKENVRNRLRQRRMNRKHRGGDDVDPALESAPSSDGGVGGIVVGPGGQATLQPPPPQPAVGANGLTPGSVMRDDQAMYDYFVPSRYSTQGMRNQIASQGYFTTPSGAKIYSNAGLQQGTTSTPPSHPSPWYQIRRVQRPVTFANQDRLGGRRTQSYDDVSMRPQPQPTAYPTQTMAAPVPGIYGSHGSATHSQTCPMCGVTNEHSHANYVHVPPPPPTQQYTYAQESSPTRKSRPRSRSASRSRHYSPERMSRSQSHTRYHVREYDRVLSDSDDDRRMSRTRRSRSASRRRSRPTSPVQNRYGRRRSHYSGSDESDSLDEGLDRSLSLSVDISRLTKKMMGALKGELRRTKDKREFGSSYW